MQVQTDSEHSLCSNIKNKNLFVSKFLKNLNLLPSELNEPASVINKLRHIPLFKFFKNYSKKIFILQKRRKYQFALALRTGAQKLRITKKRPS